MILKKSSWSIRKYTCSRTIIYIRLCWLIIELSFFFSFYLILFFFLFYHKTVIVCDARFVEIYVLNFPVAELCKWIVQSNWLNVSEYAHDSVTSRIYLSSINTMSCAFTMQQRTEFYICPNSESQHNVISTLKLNEALYLQICRGIFDKLKHKSQKKNYCERKTNRSAVRVFLYE